MDEFRLDGAPEALSDGVVPAVALAAHAAQHFVDVEGTPVVAAGVLAPSIGVVNQPRRRAPRGNGHGKRIEAQLTVDGRAHCPANDGAGVPVDDGGQVQPPLARPDAGDVRDPDAVRFVDVEVALEQVVGDRERVLLIGGAPEALLAPRGDVVRAHQPDDALAARPTACLFEVRVDARRAVRPTTLDVGLHDFLRERLVVCRVFRWLSTSPRVVAAGRDFELAIRCRACCIGSRETSATTTFTTSIRACRFIACPPATRRRISLMVSRICA